MALSFIGKPISLISHSDVRYRGILAGIDPVASTIQLSNVYSMGTETRRPHSEYIPPVQEPYQYIIFRASEVKDLAVDEPVTRRSIHDDPAVLGASAPTGSPSYPPYPLQPSIPPQTRANDVPGVNAAATYTAPTTTTSAASILPTSEHANTPLTNAGASSQVRPAEQPKQQAQKQSQQPQQQQQQHHRSQPRSQQHQNRGVHTAAASLVKVETALRDLRVSSQNNNDGAQAATPDVAVPAADFDFASSNAKFDKAALAPKLAVSAAVNAVAITKIEDTEGGPVEWSLPEEKASAYNPQKSFFDSLSSSAPTAARGVGGRRGGGGGRTRREEEREKNVATFGEPGGSGSMNSSAYMYRSGRGRGRGRFRRGGAQANGH